MPRTPRIAPGGYVFHVLNRANDRQVLFHSEGDYQWFLALMSNATTHCEMRVLAYCLMPNHWHLVLWPCNDGDLSRFMKKLSGAHASRLRASSKTQGYGHVYQGRFK